MAMAPEKPRVNPSVSMPVFTWGRQQRFTFNPGSLYHPPFHPEIPVSDTGNRPKPSVQRSSNDAGKCKSGEFPEPCSSSFRKPPLLEKKTQRDEAGGVVRERLLIHFRVGKEMKEQISPTAKVKRIVPGNGDKFAVAAQEEPEAANQLNRNRTKARTDEDLRSKKRRSPSPLPQNVQNSRVGKVMNERISVAAKGKGIVNGEEEPETSKQLNHSRTKARTYSRRAVADENKNLRSKKRPSPSPLPENVQNSRVRNETNEKISAAAKGKGIVPVNDDKFAVAAQEELEAAEQLNRNRTYSCRAVANESEDLRSKKRRSPPPVPENVQNSWWLRSSGIQKEEKETTLPKFLLSLSRQEIFDDFMAMTGAKPPLRPKKRPLKIRSGINEIFPGQCLADVTPDSLKETYKNMINLV